MNDSGAPPSPAVTLGRVEGGGVGIVSEGEVSGRYKGFHCINRKFKWWVVIQEYLS